MLCCRLHPDAVLPRRATSGSVGYDLSNISAITVPARGRAVAQTGIAIKLPEDHYGRIAPRSGLMKTHGIDVGAGVIDRDYRGEISVVLFNHSDTPMEIKASSRIAQLVIERVITPEILLAPEESWRRMCLEEQDNQRGTSGFGSTGF